MPRLSIACAAMTAALCLSTAPAGAATNIPVVRTFYNVVLHFSSGSPSAKTLADGHCASRGWGVASAWQVGVIETRYGSGGRAYFPSISCLPKIA